MPFLPVIEIFKKHEDKVLNLDDDEVAEDEDEDVARNVKAFPVVAVPKA